eukprot:753464-Hanusia_phi.AAC.1
MDAMVFALFADELVELVVVQLGGCAGHGLDDGFDVRGRRGCLGGVWQGEVSCLESAGAAMV